MRRAALFYLLSLIPLLGFGAGGVTATHACARAAAAAGEHRAPCCPAPAPAPVKDCCHYSQPYTAIAATAVEPAQHRAAAFAILIPAPAPFISIDERTVRPQPPLHPPPLTRAPLILPLRV